MRSEYKNKVYLYKRANVKEWALRTFGGDAGKAITAKPIETSMPSGYSPTAGVDYTDKRFKKVAPLLQRADKAVTDLKSEREKLFEWKKQQIQDLVGRNKRIKLSSKGGVNYRLDPKTNWFKTIDNSRYKTQNPGLLKVKKELESLPYNENRQATTWNDWVQMIKGDADEIAKERVPLSFNELSGGYTIDPNSKGGERFLREKAKLSPEAIAQAQEFATRTGRPLALNQAAAQRTAESIPQTLQQAYKNKDYATMQYFAQRSPEARAAMQNQAISTGFKKMMPYLLGALGVGGLALLMRGFGRQSPQAHGYMQGYNPQMAPQQQWQFRQ